MSVSARLYVGMTTPIVQRVVWGALLIESTNSLIRGVAFEISSFYRVTQGVGSLENPANSEYTAFGMSFLKKQPYFTGFQPAVLARSLLSLPVFFNDMWQYSKLNRSAKFKISTKDLFPILTDRRASAGEARGHYFHQDLWAAKKIFKQKPVEHMDIGSRIDGFIAHLLVFMPVTIVDIRPLQSDLSGVTFFQDDATDLTRVQSDSVPSISSLHVAEHFGLGRYSDPIDPDACFRYMKTLQRVLSPGGRLYFSVPVGRERVEFNAHRVFDPKTIMDCFSLLKLLSFSFVGDDGRLYEDSDPLTIPESEMACGLFEFSKDSL
jgi:Caenorhabditis protein of unknown function, DUF268